MITTISTFIALQGVALLLRSTPDGYYRSSVTDALTAQIGPIPIAFIVAVGVVAVSEVILRRSRFGMELRAVGSNEVAAYRLGARVNRTIILAYVLCSLFAGVGGLLLAGQVGVGDPSVGQNYTLQSISAVVLGAPAYLAGAVRSSAPWRESCSSRRSPAPLASSASVRHGNIGCQAG